MIVTLAGHVDHGKTSLVRALTGVDTDRLAEEKQRGLTIDLGFAYIDGGALGFVDVPGHHRFIHNMVAGVASQQVALLVIAADDGPMPQSREHLQILSLIGVRTGVIAISKRDRVSAARLGECRSAVAQLVQGTFLEQAPVCETAIDDADSIDALRNQLRKCMPPASTNTGQPFRLAIDRAFSVRGAGLVVTGTAHAGRVSEADNLVHFPSGSPVRVRSLHAQDQPVSSAGSGERCALNITGIDLDAVERGHWLLAMDVPRYANVSVQLQVLADFPRPVRHWTPVHIYHATSHTTGRVALLEDNRLGPGDQALADLVCDQPLPVHHGDQLVIRDQSLDVTLGGGRVVHADPATATRRRMPDRLNELRAFSGADKETCLNALLTNGWFKANLFGALFGVKDAEFEPLLEAHGALLIGSHAIARKTLARLATATIDEVKAHVEANPSSPGLKENEFTALPAMFRTEILAALVQSGRLRTQGGHYSLPDHAAALPESLAGIWDRAHPALDELQPPSSGDLAKSWNTPLPALEKDLKALAGRGLLVHVANHRFYLPERLRSLADQARTLAASGPFTVRQFRDHAGVGRNVAIEVLEYFDSRGFTRRQGDARVLLRDAL